MCAVCLCLAIRGGARLLNETMPPHAGLQSDACVDSDPCRQLIIQVTQRMFSPIVDVFDLQALHVYNSTSDSMHPLHGCAVSTHGSMLAPLLLAVCRLCITQRMHYIYYSFCLCMSNDCYPDCCGSCVHADWPCAPAAACEAAAKAANILLPFLSHPYSKQASSSMRLMQHRPAMPWTRSCPVPGPMASQSCGC